MLLAFALATRVAVSRAPRPRSRRAVLLKQFALAAVPFVARAAPRAAGRPGASSGAPPRSSRAIVVAGFLPFLVADPAALWRDTVAYGSRHVPDHRLRAAGAAARAGVIDDRFGPYPFVIRSRS